MSNNQPDDRSTPRPDPLQNMSEAERAEAMRARLYETHKARGTLGVYYQLYPQEAEKLRQNRRDTGRER